MTSFRRSPAPGFTRSLSVAACCLSALACGTGTTSDQAVDLTGEGGAAGAKAGAAGGGASGGAGAEAGKGSAAGAAGSTGGGAGSKAGQAGTAGAGGAGAAGTAGSAGSGPTSCPAPVSCDAAPPAPGAKTSWNHTIESTAITLAGSPNHRGRDLWLNPGDDQWLIAKFAYGIIDKDLKDEDVDVWLLRDCKTWELLGTTKTTATDGMHPSVENVDDSGGRVYFQIPAAKKVGKGRHRAHFVVKGDLTTTDAYLEVTDAATPMFVSDVDGTLTTSETEEYGALLTGSTPQANPDAAQLFQDLVAKGYRPFYMTARPEFLVERTREFLKVRGFPDGLVHTTLGLTGALGSAASTYKTDELAQLAKKGLLPTYAFGNTSTDADAYFNAMVKPDKNRVFFQFTDSAHGGRRIEGYSELFGEVAGLSLVCK